MGARDVRFESANVAAPARFYLVSARTPCFRSDRNAARVQLVMPRLGEPVEPAHATPLAPWWRTVDVAPSKLRVDPRVSLPKSTPWPVD